MATHLTEREARQVVDILHSEGWANIHRHIIDNLKAKTKQITSSRDFKDLSEVTALQGEISGLRQVLSYVEACEKKVDQGGS